jgi:diguanylate cyclase (GGDEF)-like protein
VYVPDVREDGQVAGLYALSTDVTELKEVEAKLNEQARVDPLTGLPNRRAFDERLQATVARHRRTRQRLALLFLDVDHFKEINDSRGHGTGDEVLCEFARRLLTCVRQTDTVARLAGDEFVIILEGLKDVEEAVAIAEKIGLLMRLPFHVGDEIRRVTTSIGVAYVDDARIQAVDIMAKADGALYRAKRNGRDTFAVSTF